MKDKEKAGEKTAKPGNGNDAPSKEWSDEKEYDFHALAERLPLMEGDEFEDFADDIATNGQKETVKFYEDKILDGRNRYRACKARKIACRFENWNGPGDPWDYVLSLNLHRRHLTPDARQALVMELRKEGKSIRQIADTLHTSVGSVHRDIDNAAIVQDGTVDNLPATITGKDGKVRQARKSKGKTKRNGMSKTASRKKSAAKDTTTKGDRPKIADVAGIVHRGLSAVEEANRLLLKGNAVYFWVNGYQIKVACKVV